MPAGGRLRLRGRLRVDRLGELVRRLLQRLRLAADLGTSRHSSACAQLHDPTLDRRGVGLVELVAVLLERALGLVRERLRDVLRVGELAQPVRLVGVRLGVADHLLHLVLLQARAALDLDLLHVAGAEVLRARR